MLPETVARLAGHQNIAGIKEATGIIERGSQIRELCGESFAIYSGDDATGMGVDAAGANGVISVTNNVVPRQMHELCMAAMAGDRETASAINDALDALHSKLFVESNPIPVKWLLKEQGLIQDGIRLPLTPLSETFHSDLRSALKQATEQVEPA